MGITKKGLSPVVNRVLPGRICYVTRDYLSDAVRTESGQCWSLKNRLRTVKFKLGERFTFRSLDAFHADADTVARFVDECEAFGLERPPSSFSSPAWEGMEFIRRPTWTCQSRIYRHFTGAWQEAITTGAVLGPLYKYDLNSAYAWAIMQGLPHPRRIQRSHSIVPNGIYLVRGSSWRSPLPFPLHTGVEKVYVLTGEEIEEYAFSVREIITGWEWTETVRDPLVRQIERVRDHFTDWKKVLRSCWGKWCAKWGVVQNRFDRGKVVRVRKIRNPWRNFIWSHVIVSRVKMRVLRDFPDAVHVFVDSAITPSRLARVGSDIGDWKLDAVYPEGLLIFGPGRYKRPKEIGWEKHCGRKSGVL